MKIAFFNFKEYERKEFNEINQNDFNFEIEYIEAPLNLKTVNLTKGFEAVCIFVNDPLNAELLQEMKNNGISKIALRCAGFNHVDIAFAKKIGIQIVRVPSYSPNAVAEHAVGLILSLNRKLHHSFNRVRESNFSINGLMGFDLFNKTVGVIGTGQIGRVFCKIMAGFGCHVIAYDLVQNEEMLQIGVQYKELEDLYKESDIISLQCPLNEKTKYIIDLKAISMMKNGVMLINTSRGGLVDTRAVIEGLKSRKIGYLGLDVYEEESHLFFQDLSLEVLQDDIFARLLTFPNVLVTAHQAFFTKEAMQNIAKTTLRNLSELITHGKCPNEV